MKQRILPFLFAAVVALSPAALSASPKDKAAKAAAAAAAAARVEIVFQDPEKFTDVKDSQMGTDKGRDGILEELKTYLTEQIVAVMPADSTVNLTFTEIDLAGDYEPWRHHSAHDVRIVKDIYPPRFDFSYKLVAADGTVLAAGTEKLRDMSFMTRLVINRSDSLHYEKDMLRDWIRTNLRGPKK